MSFSILNAVCCWWFDLRANKGILVHAAVLPTSCDKGRISNLSTFLRVLRTSKSSIKSSSLSVNPEPAHGESKQRHRYLIGTGRRQDVFISLACDNLDTVLRDFAVSKRTKSVTAMGLSNFSRDNVVYYGTEGHRYQGAEWIPFSLALVGQSEINAARASLAVMILPLSLGIHGSEGLSDKASSTVRSRDLTRVLHRPCIGVMTVLATRSDSLQKEQ